jgi:thymidylate synthase (FAD)
MYIKLMAITPFPEELIADAYGTCTNRDVPVENIPMWVSLGHESPLEHASASFIIGDISRACLAQVTRHRIGMSYSVQSMRYVDSSDSGFVIPDLPPPWKQWYKDRVNSAFDLYIDMVANGIPKEDARFVLPLATKTKLIMTGNFRSWRHFIKLRTDKSAQWEIRELAQRILNHLVVEAPNVFRDLSAER